MANDMIEAPKTSGAAVAGLVISILGFCCAPIIGPLLGLILGLVGRSSINRNPQQVGGSGVAMAAIILGVLGLIAHVLVGVGGAYFMKQMVVMVEEMQKQMEAVQTAAEKGDWDTVGNELSGPGSLPKEEIVAKFKEAESRYGTLGKLEAAQNEPDQAEMQRDWTAWPMRVTFNGDGPHGKFNMVVDIRRVNNRFQVRSLEFRDGHVENRLNQGHRRRMGD